MPFQALPPKGRVAVRRFQGHVAVCPIALVAGDPVTALAQALGFIAGVRAMAVVDLLVDDAAKAKEVMTKSKPMMTKEQYLSLQRQRLREELYEGK